MLLNFLSSCAIVLAQSSNTTPTTVTGNDDAAARAAARGAKIEALNKAADDASRSHGKAKTGAELSELKRSEVKNRLLAHMLEKRAVTPALQKQIDNVRADENLSTGKRFEIAQLADMAQRHEKKFASRVEWLAEREAGAQELVKEFPNEARAYSNLLGVALQSSPERALPLARQILDSSADTETKDRARALATRLTIDGKYLTDALEGTPGYSAFVAPSREQMVVFYTWQPEDPASVKRAQELGAALPAKVRSYGVNLSRSISTALKAANESKLPGVQLANGRGYDHPIAVRLGLTLPGSLYAITRDGHIHNLGAVSDLNAAFAKLN
ncbi:MAG: hypothetical protein HYV96_11120 [Opitutae bacterium]|nr:hypothetical protein [Opitutae bacterium]